MTKRDYYEILGVDRNADEATIKRAYRDLAMKYHPDRNPENPQAGDKMKEINEAYAVLSDREKRRLYDTYGHRGLEGFTQEDIFRGVDFGSIFEEIFGRGFEGIFGRGFGEGVFGDLFGRREARSARQPRRGPDLRHDLEVTLEDVAFGREKKVEISKTETCPLCGGMGAKRENIKECTACHGSGQRVTEQRSAFRVFQQVTPCNVCGGRGKIITQPCEKCRGRGIVKGIKEIQVRIPKGADTGHRIRIRGEGMPGDRGGMPGDLYIFLEVVKHPLFERRDDDIYVEKETSFTQAALGGRLEDVPGLEGNIRLDIPEGTQSGAVFRIPNKGIPHLSNNGRGAEHVIVKVVTPTNLTKQEKELLRQFQRLREKD
jgi:molecular chaperone DnaJ